MANKFEATDPRGYLINCSDEAWDHIIGNRPWMAGWEETVKQAVENPTMGIYQDVDFDERHVYYMFRVVGKDRYLKVVVEITGEDAGTVITAFPTFTPKAGEKLLWLKSQT